MYSLCSEVMGNIVAFNKWWEIGPGKERGEIHPSDSWLHNREQCFSKPSDLTAGFVWGKSVMCLVWNQLQTKSQYRSLDSGLVYWTDKQWECSPQHLFWLQIEWLWHQQQVSVDDISYSQSSCSVQLKWSTSKCLLLHLQRYVLHPDGILLWPLSTHCTEFALAQLCEWIWSGKKVGFKLIITHIASVISNCLHKCTGSK